jgi:hypothetical protein
VDDDNGGYFEEERTTKGANDSWFAAAEGDFHQLNRECPSRLQRPLALYHDRHRRLHFQPEAVMLTSCGG